MCGTRKGSGAGLRPGAAFMRYLAITSRSSGPRIYTSLQSNCLDVSIKCDGKILTSAEHALVDDRLSKPRRRSARPAVTRFEPLVGDAHSPKRIPCASGRSCE